MKKIMLALVLGLLLTGSVMAKGPLTGVININTAQPAQLMLLPGIGEAKAQTIVAARSQKPFATKEDLLAVKGIGEKTLANWEGLIVFQGETTLKEVGSSAPKAAATH